MQEFTEIDPVVAHVCASPRTERWQVLEPVSGRWTWLTVYACCNHVVEDCEPDANTSALEPRATGGSGVQKAA